MSVRAAIRMAAEPGDTGSDADPSPAIICVTTLFVSQVWPPPVVGHVGNLQATQLEASLNEIVKLRAAFRVGSWCGDESPVTRRYFVTVTFRKGYVLAG